MSKELDDLRDLIDECEGCDMGATARRLRPVLARLEAAERVCESADYEDFDGGTTRRVTVNPAALRAYRALHKGANMNPLIAEIEKRQSADSRANPLLRHAQELAALKLAVEELQKLAEGPPEKPERYEGSNTGDAETYGADLVGWFVSTEARATLRAIAEKLGVKG